MEGIPSALFVLLSSLNFATGPLLSKTAEGTADVCWWRLESAWLASRILDLGTRRRCEVTFTTIGRTSSDWVDCDISEPL
jgi:hypothetical protein